VQVKVILLTVGSHVAQTNDTAQGKKRSKGLMQVIKKGKAQQPALFDFALKRREPVIFRKQ
jgi:hypothetical protein